MQSYQLSIRLMTPQGSARKNCKAIPAEQQIQANDETTGRAALAAAAAERRAPAGDGAGSTSMAGASRHWSVLAGRSEHWRRGTAHHGRQQAASSWCGDAEAACRRPSAGGAGLSHHAHVRLHDAHLAGLRGIWATCRERERHGMATHVEQPMMTTTEAPQLG